MLKQIGDKVICSKCGKNKPLNDFPNHGDGYVRKDGRQHWKTVCKDCHAAYAREWRRNNPRKYTETRRQGKWRRNYGISSDDYYKILDGQSGGCAICGKNTNGDMLAVDHDHKNGEVRGLLCHRCNTALGLVDDCAEVLRKMIAYLEGTVSSTETEADSLKRLRRSDVRPTAVSLAASLKQEPSIESHGRF